LSRNSGWPSREDLDQRTLIVLEIGQHPQRIERFDRQGLDLVDDQQDALAGACLGPQEGFDFGQYLGAVEAAGIDREGLGDEAEQLTAVNMGRDDAPEGQARAIDRFGKVRDDRRLAAADLAGDDDEPLALGPGRSRDRSSPCDERCCQNRNVGRASAGTAGQRSDRNPYTSGLRRRASEAIAQSKQQRCDNVAVAMALTIAGENSAGRLAFEVAISSCA